MDQDRRIEAPHETLVLRRERPEDEPFLFRLFAASRTGMLRLAGIPEPTIAHLLSVQHRSQTASYRAAFPVAAFLVVEFDGAPVGRMVEAAEPGGTYIVDVAFLPEMQRRGFGTALVRSLQEKGSPHGRGLRAQVALGNEPSLAMFRKLGFVEAEAPGCAHVDMCWRPGG